MADFGATELDAFAAEVRKELAAMYPPELRDPKAKTDPEAVWGGRKAKWTNPEGKLWLDRMAARGWTAPTWPKAYGGGGLSNAEARV
ncbi:MAG TPA: acyl-CoA dehydrogenase, partial [Phenylobacterium sp.]|nr:acyl-CoA dehydrogenase [Phenylobacterium sp.]